MHRAKLSHTATIAGIVLALGTAPVLGQISQLRQAPIERGVAPARWPDVIHCHFPQRNATDAATGVSSGKILKAYTPVSHLVLAPAADGRYYYSDGPIGELGNGEAGGHSGQTAEATLIFNADGSQFGPSRSDCAGKSISQLVASGQAH